MSALPQECAEKRLRWVVDVFAKSPNGVIVTDLAGTIVEVNPAFTAVTGYSRSEVVGHNARLLHSGLHEPSFYQGMWRALTEKGAWQGEISNRRKSGEIVVELLSINAIHDEEGRLSHYIGTFSDITRFKEYQRQLEQMAHYDSLTQLPNRVLLEDRIAQAIAWIERQGSLLAVCYLDLDGFKPVNDLYGHQAGDMLLVEVADRLRSMVREGDTVARMGGDEFVLLLADIDTQVEVEATVQRILDHIRDPLATCPQVELSASIGVTIYPIDSSDPDILLRHADQAMYRAKERGRSAYHVFDPELDRRTRDFQKYRVSLQKAVQKGQFRLYYQPKADLELGRVSGFEALLRWQHPEKGLLLPGAFLPGIAETDLAIEIDLWVIAEALRQMAVWQEQGIALPVSVNVSSRLLQWPHFETRLRDLLARHPGVPAQRLELEILESSALDDLLLVGRVIQACNRLGVGFALDDFGSGYSSLAYLKRLPAQVLKIDRSFVADLLADPGDMAIVEGIIGMASAFRRKVVAEGVETPEQARQLLRLGCSIVQGFGIAHPMPASAIAGWLAGFSLDAAWEAASA